MQRSSSRHRPSGLQVGVLAIIVCWPVFQPAAADPAPSSLTEPQAIALALEGPGVPALRDALGQAASASELGAATWRNPRFGWDHEGMLSGASDREDVVALTLPVDLSGRRGLRTDAAAMRRQVAAADVRVLNADVVAATRSAYAELLYASARAEVLVRWRAALDQTRAVIAARVAAGAAAEWALARLDRERAEAARLGGVAEADIAWAWAPLAALTGLAPEALSRPALQGTLLPDAPGDAGRLQDAADAAPGLDALDAEGRAAALEARAAGRGWVPEVGIRAGYKHVNLDGAGGHGVVLGLEIPLPTFDRGQGEAGHARAEALRASGSHAREQARRRARVVALAAEVRHLRAVVAAYRREVVDASRRLVDLAEQAYRGGEAGLLELLDAQRGARDAELEALALALRTRRARVSLDRETVGGSR